MKTADLLPLKVYQVTLTLLHSERPKLFRVFCLSECYRVKIYVVLAFLGAIGLRYRIFTENEE